MFKKTKRVFLAILLALVILIIMKKIPFIGFNFKSLEKVIVIDAGHGGNDSGTLLPK
ncbi:hypothetical protein [Schnuerera ultunensis]|uniref:hypothetical protein n=1 Tax=Schnuerera ultunensis TaxID=45497 RepID=UPI000409DB66|nr:hypothetical protein [Schnuerera ultunensis]